MIEAWKSGDATTYPPEIFLAGLDYKGEPVVEKVSWLVNVDGDTVK